MLAFILDLDGTTADTQHVHALIEHEILLAHDIRLDPEEITARFSGVSLGDMFSEIFADAGISCPDIRTLAEEKYRRLDVIPPEQIIPIEGTVAMIHHWHTRKIPLAIGSASQIIFIERVLHTLNIRECFKTIASSHEVAQGKPAPDVFLLAAKRLGVDPQECIVVEDGVSGMIAARKAGMRCIALATNGQRDYPADLVVDDLRKVPEEFLFVVR